MYFWKCWRDTRGTLFALLGAVLAVGAFGAYVALDPLGWLAAKPLDARILWQYSSVALLGTMLGTAPVAGFWLGALGVGAEFEKGTADFLLTRPRARGYFLWASWAVGAAHMAALVLAAHVAQLTRSDPRAFGSLWVFLRSLAALGTLALLFYTLTYLMTTLAGNSRHGIALTLGVIIVYEGLWMWLRFWYDINIPFFFDLWRAASPTSTSSLLPLVAGWLAVCLALMLAAQFRFERAEV